MPGGSPEGVDSPRPFPAADRVDRDSDYGSCLANSHVLRFKSSMLCLHTAESSMLDVGLSTVSYTIVVTSVGLHMFAEAGRISA